MLPLSEQVLGILEQSTAREAQKQRDLTAPQRLQRQAAIRKAHACHTAAGVARYRVAMQGCGWQPTQVIEQKLGYGRTVANSFLRKLVKMKLVARRPRDNEPTYNRKKGWEYKWNT